MRGYLTRSGSRPPQRISVWVFVFSHMYFTSVAFSEIFGVRGTLCNRHISLNFRESSLSRGPPLAFDGHSNLDRWRETLTGLGGIWCVWIWAIAGFMTIVDGAFGSAYMLGDVDMDPIALDHDAILFAPTDNEDPPVTPFGALTLRPPFGSFESSADLGGGPSRFYSLSG